jgi:hypothetical protein
VDLEEREKKKEKVKDYRFYSTFLQKRPWRSALSIKRRMFFSATSNPDYANTGKPRYKWFFYLRF